MKIGGKVLSFCLAASLLMAPAVANGQKDERVKAKKGDSSEPKLERLVDQNRNKVFDNLEERLTKASDAEKLPVIIQFDSSQLNEKASKALEKQIGKFIKKYEYSIIDGIAATLTKQQIKKLEKLPFVKHVEYDVEMKTTMATANQWFGTEKARTDFSVTGDRDGNPNAYSKNDVVVAVIDTGIDASHVDLDNGKVIGWKDFVNNRTTPYDDQGHGTHVAGIVAGEGQAASSNKGVAPGAALVGIKVLDRNGSGSMSDIAAGIDWAVQNKNTYGINVLNLSLGSSASSDGTDASSQAVNRAVDAGLVVAVAAGNSGKGNIYDWITWSCCEGSDGWSGCGSWGKWVFPC